MISTSFDLSRRYEGLDRKRDPLPLIANLTAIMHQALPSAIPR
jgi:hypothetical protein